LLIYVAISFYRYDGDPVHLRLPLNISLPLSFIFRRSPLFRSHGRHADPGPTLPPHTSIQPLPAPGPRLKRKTEIYRHVDQPVSLDIAITLGQVLSKVNRNADVPRALVRDMYTKSWSAFDRLVAIVPPGGSIGSVLMPVEPLLNINNVDYLALTTNSLASGSYRATASPSPTSKVSSASKLASK
jgi:hypothetical protein